MSTIPAFQSGLQGIQTGFKSLNNNVQKIAQNSIQPDKQSTEAMVGLLQDRLQIEASIKVVKTSNDTLGTLLDLKV